jgi:hypothetical protein
MFRQGYYEFLLNLTINLITTSYIMKSEKRNHNPSMQQYAVLVKIIKVYIILLQLSEIKQDLYLFSGIYTIQTIFLTC